MTRTACTRACSANTTCVGYAYSDEGVCRTYIKDVTTPLTARIMGKAYPDIIDTNITIRRTHVTTGWTIRIKLSGATLRGNSHAVVNGLYVIRTAHHTTDLSLVRSSDTFVSAQFLISDSGGTPVRRLQSSSNRFMWQTISVSTVFVIFALLFTCHHANDTLESHARPKKPNFITQ